MNKLIEWDDDELSYPEKIKTAIYDGLLDRKKHKPLLRNLEKYLADSNININHLCSKLDSVCSKLEVNFLKKRINTLNNKNIYGLAYLGQINNIYNRFSCLAGFYLRNTVYSNLKMVAEVKVNNYNIDPTVLLVPNFCLKTTPNDTIPHWRVSEIYNVLSKRLTDGKFTILYIEDENDFKLKYGKQFYDFIKSSYKFYNKGTIE